MLLDNLIVIYYFLYVAELLLRAYLKARVVDSIISLMLFLNISPKYV